MKKAVEKFIQRINEIQEIDYGDFMRRANNYLIDLQDHITDTADIEAQRLLADMKLHLQYYPNWNVELTKNYILNEVKLIDQLTDQHI